MSNMLRVVLLFGAVVAVGAFPTLTGADEGDKKGSNSSEVDAGSAKEKVLRWIDDYRKKQVLFHDDDIAKLRQELADDTPEEALKWWTKSADARAALDSPQWKETREWLREFLKVQAIYSDEHVDEFRTETKEAVKQESPREFKEILADIENKRARMIQGSANAAALRKDKLAVVQAFRQEEEASRRAAEKSAATAATFNTNSGRQAVQPRAPRHSRPPLINSLDAARWGVMRGFWRY